MPSDPLGLREKEFLDDNDFMAPPQYQEANRVYHATFRSLNKENLEAHGLFWIKEAQFYARIVILHAAPRTRIQQYVHQGTLCPTMKDDLNVDGKLDFSEVILSSGRIL